METEETTAGSSCIKAEREEKSASKNDQNGTSDSEEVSPSATDESTGNPWSSLKCVFCDKSSVRFEEVKLLECLHSACQDCINTQSSSLNSAEQRSNFTFLVCTWLANPCASGVVNVLCFLRRSYYVQSLPCTFQCVDR